MKSFRSVLFVALLSLSPFAQASAPSCLVTVAPASERPLSRFESRLLVVSEAAQPATSKREIVQALASEKVRRSLLELQALAKLYEAMDSSKSDLKRVADFRTEVKDVEGALGDFMREVELFERTKGGGGSPKLLRAIETRVRAKEDELLKFMKKEGWLPDPASELAALERKAADFDFKRAPKDQKRILKVLIEKVDEARDQLKNLDKYFASSTFTEDDLENGTHSLRRALRWAATMIQSADGVFVYAPARPQSQADVDLLQKYIASKYVKLAPGGRIAIDPLPMVRLSHLVSELGRLKDFKESQLDLAHVLLDDGFEKSQKKAEASAEVIMTKNFGATNVESEARALYAYYKSADPLKDLSRQLRQRLSELN